MWTASVHQTMRSRRNGRPLEELEWHCVYAPRIMPCVLKRITEIELTLHVLAELSTTSSCRALPPDHVPRHPAPPQQDSRRVASVSSALAWDKGSSPCTCNLLMQQTPVTFVMQCRVPVFRVSGVLSCFMHRVKWFCWLSRCVFVEFYLLFFQAPHDEAGFSSSLLIRLCSTT